MNLKHLIMLGASLFATLDAAGEATIAAAPLAALQSACKPDATPAAQVPGIVVRSMPAAPGDLPYLEARSSVTGALVRIYYEIALAGAAQSRAACFAGLLDLLAPVIPDTRPGQQWSAMVLTADPAYFPQRRDAELRWSNVFTSAEWDEKTMDFLLRVMPHEETHTSQFRSQIKLPRWFQEGHAEWAGLHVTAQVAPELARRRRLELASELAKFEPVQLAAWGGLKVKPEAIERQLSDEDRARKARDPSYSPPGTFSFAAGDFVEDIANVPARYGAALAVFDGLEKRHGLAVVQAWIAAVLASTDPRQIVPLARQHFGEDITPLLQ